jgi:hypothetical protein
MLPEAQVLRGDRPGPLADSVVSFGVIWTSQYPTDQQRNISMFPPQPRHNILTKFAKIVSLFKHRGSFMNSIFEAHIYIRVLVKMLIYFSDSRKF